MSFDLDRMLRRLKPSRLHAPISRRRDEDLPFVGANPRAGAELLLDTTVYIDGLQDKSPLLVDDLMQRRICNHSAVCLAELTHAYGRLVPAHPMTASTLRGIGETIN